MKINYADRRNDKNILKKKFKIMDTNDKEFSGKISLIEIGSLKENFEARRPDGTSEIVIAKDYKMMIYYPTEERYSMTVMYDNKWNLLQWYFDIEKDKCKYDLGIPYSEDFYLDVVVLPDGSFYHLDEDELEEVFHNKLISQEEYNMAYETRNKVIEIIKNDFSKLCDFTQKSLENLKS